MACLLPVPGQWQPGGIPRRTDRHCFFRPGARYFVFSRTPSIILLPSGFSRPSQFVYRYLPVLTVSSTEKLDALQGCAGTNAHRSRSRGRPCGITEPFNGGSNPAIVFNKVDFPMPLGPKMPVIFPQCNCSVMSSKGYVFWSNRWIVRICPGRVS